MPLNRGEINPLSLLGLRRLNFIPNHFTKIKLIGRSFDLKLLDHWINQNLNSRYAIVTSLDIDDNKKIIETIEIGLEDSKEMMILTLGCPHLHKN